MVDREASFLISWTGERLDLPARDLSHEPWVSHHGAVLLSHLLRFHSNVWILNLHHHPLAFPMFIVFRESSQNLFVTCLGDQFFVTENDVVCISRAMGRKFAFHRSLTKKFSLGGSVVGFHAYEVFSRTERNSDARGHRSVPIENSVHFAAEDPELTEEHGDHDGPGGELDARVSAPFLFQRLQLQGSPCHASR